ncbi:MAG: hypothetical protein ACRETB_01490 [Steroidobacteraceae bacterium]
MTLTPLLDSPGLKDQVGRELLMLLCALAFGFVAMPPLLWFAGRRALGPYAGGGVEALAENFFQGLKSGTLGFWVVALAPYCIVLLVRALAGIARSLLPAAE